MIGFRHAYRTLAFSSVLATLVLPSDVSAHCQDHKLRSLALATTGVFGCNAKAGLDPATLAACIEHEITMLRRAFAKAESQRNCITTNDAPLLIAQLRTFYTDALSHLSCPTHLRRLGQYAAASLRTYASIGAGPNPERLRPGRLAASLSGLLRGLQGDTQGCDIGDNDKDRLRILADGFVTTAIGSLRGCAPVSAETFQNLSFGPWLDTLKHAFDLGYTDVSDAFVCPSDESFLEHGVPQFAGAVLRLPLTDQSTQPVLRLGVLPTLGYAGLERRAADGSVALFTPTGGIGRKSDGTYSAVDGSGLPLATPLSRDARGSGSSCSDPVCDEGYAAFFECLEKYCRASGTNSLKCAAIGVPTTALGFFGIPAALILTGGIANVAGCRTPEGRDCTPDEACLTSICTGRVGRCRLTSCVTRDRTRNGIACGSEADGFFARFPRCGRDERFIANGTCIEGACLPRGKMCEPEGAVCRGPDGSAACVVPTPTPTSPTPSPTFTPTACGNGQLDAGEACDTSASGGPQACEAAHCRSDCTCAPFCGDNVCNGSEDPCNCRADCGAGCGPRGDSWGDPHLITFDRLSYDFQAVGEFVFARSLDDSFLVHVRFAPFGSSRRVSGTNALAMRVGTERVAVYATRVPALYINGAATDLSSPIVLPGGGTVQMTGGVYVVTWPDGSVAQVSDRGSYLNVTMVHASVRAGRVEGLLGNSDTIRTNDLVTSDGMAPPPGPFTRDWLYDQYGNSWRVSQEDSLFNYEAGETTETFTDRTFPGALVTINDLEAAAREEARAICLAAGITDPILLQACILDVGLTGDPSFSEFPAAVTPPAEAIVISATVIPFKASGYRYKIVEPGTEAGFETPAFDDSAFSDGAANFGGGGCTDEPVTPWPLLTDILVRRVVEFPAGATNLRLTVVVDDSAHVFFNGQDLGKVVNGGCARAFQYTIPDNLIVPGPNLLAVRGNDIGTIDFLDMQLTASVPQ